MNSWNFKTMRLGKPIYSLPISNRHAVFLVLTGCSQFECNRSWERFFFLLAVIYGSGQKRKNVDILQNLNHCSSKGTLKVKKAT